jgi:phage terminase large subunit
MQTQSVKPEIQFAFLTNLSKARRGIPVRVDRSLEDKKLIWKKEPDRYAFERLKTRLTSAQTDILYSVKNHRRTAVKAHHALGKTFDAAIAQLWWIDCWSSHIGYITAPTWSQALALTFKQAKRLAMLNNLGFDILDSGLIRDKDPFKATERFIKALNAQNGEGFQGEHTAPILIVLDEATGIPSYIFDAAGGLMTNADCRILEIANPTDEATDFGEHCESANYNVLSFSALEHENIEAELLCQESPFPGAVSLQWLFEMLRDEAERVDSRSEDCFEFYTLEVIENALNGHPVNSRSEKCFYKPTAYFQGRVLGEFPTEASSKVIPKAWLKFLSEKPIKPGKVQIGCDVARFGDDRTTMFARIGQVVIKAKVLRKFDNLAVTQAIRDLVEEVIKYLVGFGFTVTKKDITIAIDTTGGLGTAPYDTLKSEGYSVVAVNSSSTPKDAEKYINVRSELWFDVRDRAKDNEIDYSRLEPDLKRALTKELGTPEYKVNAKGKKVVEDKAEIKKRLGASPDLADGFNLSFYEPLIQTSGSMDFEDY